MKFTVFGEILWDIFGDEKTIGGAPFNFAAHALKLGADIDFISAVGDDGLGKEVLKECKRLGIPTDDVAVIDKPTGIDIVTLTDGLPAYELVTGVAYDFIPLPAKASNDGAFDFGDMFCFGTLAQRGETSRTSLQKLLAMAKSIGTQVFLDINIRQHYYTDEIIDDSLKATDILKISREEIGVVGIDGTPEDICRALAKKYPNLKLIIVTLDSDGAFAYETADGKITYSEKPFCKVVSTVGAGDSFSGGFLVSFLKGLSISESLGNAVRLAGYVCEHMGAIPDYSPEQLGFK